MRGTGLAGQFNPKALDASSVSLPLGDGRTIAARVQRVAIASDISAPWRSLSSRVNPSLMNRWPWLMASMAATSW
jgi:hypothetical protein